MVRVTSTVTHSVTCGAVKAEPTIAPAIILRTPLIGSRVSRSPVAAATARRRSTPASERDRVGGRLDVGAA